MRAENKFERFRGFLELISRFEFEFRRCGIFFEGFEFLVCSKFNHTQCGPPCACAAACLHPHNSISNVVASVTIHDDIYIYIYIYILFFYFFKKECRKNMKPLWNVKIFFNWTSWKVSDVQIVRYTWVFGGERQTRTPPQLPLRRAEQLYQVKRIIGLRSAQNVKVMKSQTRLGKRPSRLSEGSQVSMQCKVMRNSKW